MLATVPTVKPVLNRRERVRETTRVELVAGARSLLVDDGLDAVTVREVARTLGMTAPAIYRYFPSREALLEEVIDALYDELADHIVAARESARSGNLADRFLLTSRSFRQWARDNRPEFGLLFGAPVPGVGSTGHAKSERGQRFAAVWLELFVEIDQGGGTATPWARPMSPALRAQIRAYVDSIGQPVAVETAMLYLYCWQNLYGFICTEVFGHLSWAVTDATEMFEDRLAEFRELLGLPLPTTLGRR